MWVRFPASAFLYFYNWMARPILTLGVLMNRVIYQYSYLGLFWKPRGYDFFLLSSAPELQNHIAEYRTIFCRFLKQRHCTFCSFLNLKQKYSLITRNANPKWHTLYNFTSKLKQMIKKQKK